MKLTPARSTQILIHIGRTLTAVILGLFLIRVGILHFTKPTWFAPIVPEILGDPLFWVYLSGAAEILLGVGLLAPRPRRSSALATAVFLILVYPANLNMWINDIALGDGTVLSGKGHFIRLLVQITAIGVCLWVSRKPKT